MDNFNERQLLFLKQAEKAGVNQKLFGNYVPEIRFEEEKINLKKPTIAYIHTGGTLAMVPSQNKNGALTFEGAIDIEKVISIADSVSNIRYHYNIIGIFLSNLDSKEVKSDLWTALAATIKTIYDDVDGIVIGHGTHTLEYTSAAIAFCLRNVAIPIVFTASQIPIMGFPGSDGLSNLTGAMEIAARSDLAEVVVYCNGQIFRGARVTKKNDQRLDAFEARITGPCGYLTAAGIELLPGTRGRGGKQKYELIFQPNFNPSITTLRLNPGVNMEQVQLIIESQKDVGMILETYGSGAIPKDLVEILSKYLNKGFPIFLTSSCAESGISTHMEGHDEDAQKAIKAGIITAKDMTTAAATVKLMNIMSLFGNYTKEDNNGLLKTIVKEMVEKNYAGEITVSRGLEDY